MVLAIRIRIMITSFQELHPAEEPEDVYLPSPERIARMCRHFQEGWSDRERIKRGHIKPQRWTAPEVSMALDSSLLSDE